MGETKMRKLFALVASLLIASSAGAISIKEQNKLPLCSAATLESCAGPELGWEALVVDGFDVNSCAGGGVAVNRCTKTSDGWIIVSSAGGDPASVPPYKPGLWNLLGHK